MRTFLTILLAAICVVGYSQKKPKINQALSALESGELSEAKAIIDAAIEHEKTKDDAKTWYYRGQIYAALDTANNEPGALEESLKAFDKALELDPEQKSITTFGTTGIENIDSKRQGYYAYYYNEAINRYNEEAFEAAAENFETAYYINPADTNAILNAAYAASSAGLDKKAEENFKKSYEAGVRDKSLFLQLYNYAVKEERFEDALAIMQQGKEAIPNDPDFAKYEISLLIELDRTEEAKSELLTAIENDPQNADLHFSLGVLKDELGDKKGAIESYDNAIAIDSEHYNSNFNKGVYIFNQANELIKERNALSYKEDKKIKELTAKIEVKLKDALPTWEKLYSLNSTDQTVLETLSYIYLSLKMNDKADKIQDELDAIKN
ncbi:tetratricopeptide repeat protein [Ekhidna sp.]|uniref:tetratricopeptide repeat protein n=1 Tax=Ekhidna sp. TaxID=2608089 RepID=UPI003B50ABB5